MLNILCKISQIIVFFGIIYYLYAVNFLTYLITNSMFTNFQPKNAVPAVLLGIGTLLLIHSCKVDDRYSLDNIKDVDTEVTVFEDGLTIPLVQSTARITVDSILRKAGVNDSSFGDYLKQEADGSYYLSYETQFSLEESIKDLDLKGLVDIEPVAYSQSVDYELSSLDASSLKTDSQSFSTENELEMVSFQLNDFDPVTNRSTLLTQKTVKDAAAAASFLRMTKVTLPDVDLKVESDDAEIKGADLSDKIESIDEINMKKGSRIKVEASLSGGIFATGEITPKVNIDLEDVLTLADGTGSLDCSSMVLSPSNGFAVSKTFEVTKLNAAKLTEDRSVGVSGNIVAKSLSASVADASAIASDVEVLIKISFENFEVENVHGKLKEMSYSLDSEGEKFTFELPDEVSGFGAFTISPKGNPAISLSLVIPEIDGVKIESEEGAVIQIPEFLKLKDVPSDFVYDEKSNTLLLKEMKTADYKLRIDRIEVNPQNVGGKYMAEGQYAVKCTLGLPNERMDIYKLNGLSGQKFAIGCEIPSIEAREVTLDELSIDVDQKSSIDVIKASDIPDMVKSVGEIRLDGTTANIDLNLKNLPDIGDGKFYVDIAAQLPDFIVPSTIDISGEIRDGKFSKSVQIEKIDFSNVDLEKLRKEGKSISGDVLVKGSITADNPSVDIEKISQSITGQIVMNIAGKDGKIAIDDIAAKVEYQIDSSLTVDFFELPEAIEGSTFDLPNAELVAKVVSNLAIPMNAKLDLNDGMYDLDVKFPYSENPSEFKTVENRYTLDLNPLLTEGKEKLPVRFALNVTGDRESHVNPDAEYDMDIDLGFKVPLKLGSECSITYSDTLDISKNAETIAKVLEKNAVKLFGTVESTMPFSVGVKAELLSFSNGTYSVIPTAEPVESILAQPSGKNEFSVGLKVASGVNLDNLSHIRFSFTLGADGSQLNSGDYILLEDLGVRVPEGITVDVSE